MKPVVPIAEDIYWIGVNDRNTELFESLWPLPRGVAYNSYLILDQKVVLVDTVKSNSLGTYLGKIRSILGTERGIDYLIVNHMEPDHAGLIDRLVELYPGIQLVGNKKTAKMLVDFFDLSENVLVVEDGDELDLGRRKLQFHLTPMVHWPETMMTYVPDGQILFSGDAFGSFGTLDGGIFDDEIDFSWFENEMLRYYSNIVGKYSKMVQNALKKLAGLPVSVIASTHGPVWRESPEHVIGLYDRWSRQESEPGCVLVYGSMYNNTEKMVEMVARGVAEAGIKHVRIYNAAKTHVSYILRDTWRYQALVLCTPTYDVGIFPAMERFVSLLESKRLTGRTLGIAGTFGWSGGGVKGLKKFAENSGWTLVEPSVEACCSPTAEDLDACYELGRNIAAELED